MIKWKRCAKINLKVLIILLIVTVALGASLFTARQIRRSFLSKAALRAGQEAYENEDWQAAYRNFREYLGRNPDDIEILKKYATAGLSIRPLNDNIINRVIAAYRQVMRLDPQEEIAYDKLAMLYTGTGNYEELAYIARTKIDDDPNNPKAHLWLGEALKELNKTTEAKKELNNEIITKLKPLLPLKYPEYVRACVLTSQIILDEKAYDAEDNARDMLNAAVDYDPNSLEALASRARFNRQLAFDPGKKDNERKDYLNLAKQDLNKADTIGTENPLILFIMAEEWIACREPDRAADELKKLENLSPEIIQKYFLDLNLWTVAKFQLAAKLAIQKRDIDEGISRANETLNALDDKKYRAQVLPYAIEIFVNADDQESKSKARAYLDEFTDILYTNVGQTEFGQYLVYLRAIVAKAENNPYEVIDILQPAVVSDDTRPELWGLLAEAFIQTDQPRRAINALLKYLRLRPGDTQMTLLLAKEYLKLQNWSKAFQAAQLAETMDPADIILALLRIEASINIAVSQITFDEARLLKLEGELAELRTEHTDRIDIRILQAIIAEYLKRPQEAENELKKAIEECSETLSAEIQLVRFYYRAKRSSDDVHRL